MNQAVDDIAGMEDEPAAKEEPKGKDAADGKGAPDGKGAETNGKAQPAKAKAAKAAEDSDPKVKGKQVAADGEEAAEEAAAQPAPDRKSDELGERVSVRVDHGGRRNIKK